MEATLRKTGALLGKDLKDVVKNPTMLVCCLLPVGFMLFYKNAVGGHGRRGGRGVLLDARVVVVAVHRHHGGLHGHAERHRRGEGEAHAAHAHAGERERRADPGLARAGHAAGHRLGGCGLLPGDRAAVGRPAGVPRHRRGGIGAHRVAVASARGWWRATRCRPALLSMPILVAGIAPMFAQMVDGLSDIAPTCPPAA
ncbi:MAG: ABC transporter permease [Gordonibacter pamelaeae]